METIKNILAKIDGKKSYTGIIAAVAYGYLTSNGILTSDSNIWNSIFGLIGIGVLHKFEKFGNN